MAAYCRQDDLKSHLRTDCLYTRISSGPTAQQRVWESFTFTLRNLLTSLLYYISRFCLNYNRNFLQIYLGSIVTRFRGGDIIYDGYIQHFLKSLSVKEFRKLVHYTRSYQKTKCLAFLRHNIDYFAYIIAVVYVCI